MLEERNQLKKECITVAFATDSNYQYYTGAALYTLLNHISVENTYHIIILSSNLSREEQHFFQDLIQPYNKTAPHVSLEYVDMEKWVKIIGKEKFFTGNFAIANYYRLFLPFILKDEKKVIYLDSDIIVKGDIAKLWDIDMEGNAIAAALDFSCSKFPVTLQEMQLSKYCKNILQLKNSAEYFNSGVLLLDLEKLRAMDFLQVVQAEINTGIEFLLVDQDILNRVFQNAFTILPPLWNYIPGKNKKLLPKAHIIHFAGYRPWLSIHKPFASLWWQEAEQLPFYQKILENRKNARIKYLEEIEKRYYDISNCTCWLLTAPLRKTVEYLVCCFKMLRKG